MMRGMKNSRGDEELTFRDENLKLGDDVEMMWIWLFTVRCDDGY